MRIGTQANSRKAENESVSEIVSIMQGANPYP